MCSYNYRVHVLKSSKTYCKVILNTFSTTYLQIYKIMIFSNDCWCFYICSLSRQYKLSYLYLRWRKWSLWWCHSLITIYHYQFCCQRFDKCQKSTKFFHITDDIEGHAGPPCAPRMDGHTGDLSPSAQVQLGGVELQSAALAKGAVPRLPVARYAAWSQRSGLPVGVFEFPAQLQGERGEAGRLTLDGQSLAGNREGQRGGVDGEGWRLWVEGRREKREKEINFKRASLSPFIGLFH